MGGVLPEIEHAFAMQLAHGDAVVRIENGKDRVVILLIVGIGFEELQRDRILLVHPFERLLPMDILEPEIGIVRHIRPVHRRHRS